MKTIDELKKLAIIPWEPQISFKSWCHSANRLLSEVKLTFVDYFIGINIRRK